jgi:hypothetical protein
VGYSSIDTLQSILQWILRCGFQVQVRQSNTVKIDSNQRRNELNREPHNRRIEHLLHSTIYFPSRDLLNSAQRNDRGLVEAQYSSTTVIQHPPISRPAPSQFPQVGFTHNTKPRVLRLAYVLSRRQNVNSFIKYGDVEAVRVDRAYCGLEPGR